MKHPRILLADDHALMLDGFSNLLKDKYAVVGTVEDGKALVEAATRLNPDLIILDITMPILNGIDAARETVLGGSRYVTPGVGGGGLGSREPARAGASPHLTARERQILQLTAEG